MENEEIIPLVVDKSMEEHVEFGQGKKDKDKERKDIDLNINEVAMYGNLSSKHIKN